ncbi:BppU family phage baseplate upper protein [Olsenella sp. Marseille-P4559]|uniref:BppU family phage baseplate upper protein n=1 Tax=Olsenella sp. Marseille-P4559 TaxID=2364795 RepID=UPI001030912B|nr:BppU family phage baseplate upper protein [Olsenella sp. Marseille-P4559]
MNTQTLELDLSKDGLGTNLLRVGQGDDGGTTIRALVYDSGTDASLSGYSAYLEVLLPDRTHYYRAAATVSGNVVTVTVDESKLCAVAGFTDQAYFAFEQGHTRYSTERFSIEVLKSVTANAQPAQSWDDAIDRLIDRGNSAVNAANTAATNARNAAKSANDAASKANAARIANSLAASMAAYESSVAELKSANAVLATTLAGLQDNYVVMTETAYMPTSRVTALVGETLTCAKASMSGASATLK